ncbi:hypothetical protein [uncultured Ruegeria sp.]|uniref:hypothetical protein n=1 Tax=uncultured Ruegeria sp. TaxID=259304 RepID=UPI00260EF501|nr:hypothetical protein [uncultured Ruegeria sp.]
MPLVFTGKSGATPEFQHLLEAYSGTKRVVVVTSQEAIDDQGIPAIEQKASDKYDAGLTDEQGRVRVFTSDF